MSKHSTVIAKLQSLSERVALAQRLLDTQLDLAETFAASVAEGGQLEAQRQLETLLAGSHCLDDAVWALHSYVGLLAYEDEEVDDGKRN